MYDKLHRRYTAIAIAVSGGKMELGGMKCYERAYRSIGKSEEMDEGL
jgi:hypothetical protein